MSQENYEMKSCFEGEKAEGNSDSAALLVAYLMLLKVKSGV